MTSRKNPSAFFEIVRSNKNPSQKLKVPNWWKANAKPSRPGFNLSKLKIIKTWCSWLTRPARISLPRGVWLIFISLILVFGLIGYRNGLFFYGGDLARTQADHRSRKLTAQLKTQPVNAFLLKATSGQRNKTSQTADIPAKQAVGAKTGLIGQKTVIPVAGDSTSGGAPGSGDGRIVGLNYFCLETVPGRYKNEAGRAADFLRGNLVDVTLVPVHNNQIQLIALKGFERPGSDPAAREYARLLRSLGRVWKAEHRGWSDWRDLYAIKYRPAEPRTAQGR